jgi:imidazolonepropionase-like amidohydrolase
MSAPPNRVLIRDVRIFDGRHDEVTSGHVLIVGDRIEEVSANEISVGDANVIEGGGRVLMPGLTDAHVHLMGSGNTTPELMTANLGLIYANTFAEARRMLSRGFTTIRDIGGDVVGVKAAIDAGTMPGPRIYPSQAMISQTGGHGDFGPIYEAPTALGGHPSRGETIGFVRVADGPDRVLAAVREQLKAGASQIKLMAGGGVASLYDPLDTKQFTAAELRAAVQAAEDWGTYVAVHVYNSEGVRRAVDAGVKSIEHAHLVDEDTVHYLAENNVWLSTQPFAEHDHHYPNPHQATKNRDVCAGTDRLFRWAQLHGVKTAFGTDLLFEPDTTDRQIEMLVRLADYMTPIEALKMVTSTNTELFRLSGERDPYRDAHLGVIEQGAWADLLVIDGDPTINLGVLTDYKNTITVIIKNGDIFKNTLAED